MSAAPFDRLPRVDVVVADDRLDAPRRRLGRAVVTDLARRAIARARDEVRSGRACPTLDAVIADVVAAAGAALAQRARRVVNATGIVLHTNLGRAPLGAAAALALAESAQGYTSIEIDLTTGRRGARGAFAEQALATLAGAEAAFVVNNNAAAVLLALSALAAGRAVIVSRGELIEIGGGFRVPDVLARSGARLVEVGTTNKTRVEDYAAALDANEGTAAILRVHQGNFRQTGFVARPTLGELAGLARARGVLLVEDLGGGAVLDLDDPALAAEPLARASIAAGVDVVCFSTDKVLGGPQGGAIVGRLSLVERARRDPLARALRMGRLPLVALEATLAAYLAGDLDAVPALAMIRASVAAMRARAEAWRATLADRGVVAEVVPLASMVGGGACAVEEIASAGLALAADGAERLTERLRLGTPPVLARIQGGRVVLDARTVLPGEDEALLAAIVHAVAI